MNLNKPNLSNLLPPPRFTVCHRHPGEPVTGFCAPCLSERLAGLDPASVKSIIEKGQCSKTNELSRSKSCSGYNGCKRSGFVISTNVEPRRKSCDVRGRSSLSSLFDMDDGEVKNGNFMDVSVGGLRCGREEVLGFEEVRVLEQIPICGDEEEWRTMKELIDLECRRKKQSKGRDLKNIAGNIWVAAASGFSKKLQKWKQKQKIRMRRSGDGISGVGNLNRVAMRVESRNLMYARQWRETQSEVGDYGFGRRSCDTEPRFSVDARASVDCPRFSLDEGRASWDGYLIGRSSVNRPNQMMAVVEDDDQFVEDMIIVKSGNGIDKSPGGTEQTRNYYGEGSSRRKRSSDRSVSNRRASSVELEELRAISNSRISPATVELFHGAKVLLTKNDVNIPSLTPIKTERVESSDSASIGPSSIVDETNANNKLQFKKLAGWRKAWTNWGLSQKQPETKFKFTCDEDDEESKAAGKVTSSGTHVSSSSSSSISGSFMRSSTETKSSRIIRQEQPLRLDRNKTTRYSPSPDNHDNGLLRFYLTPSRGIRSKCSKSRLQSSQDVATNALRL